MSAIEPVSGVSTTATGGDGVVVIVDGLQRLRVREGAQEMRTGDTFRLRATGVFPNPVPAPGDEPTIDVDISEFVEFSSNDPNIIRVEGDLAIAVGLGQTTVTARDPRTGILSSQSPDGDKTFVVIAALQRLKLKPGLIRTRINGNRRDGFSALGYYSDGARLEITDKVAFSTSDPGIATVSNENNRHGIVVPVAVGRTFAVGTEPITGIASPPRRIVVRGGGGARGRR